METPFQLTLPKLSNFTNSTGRNSYANIDQDTTYHRTRGHRRVNSLYIKFRWPPPLYCFFFFRSHIPIPEQDCQGLWTDRRTTNSIVHISHFMKWGEITVKGRISRSVPTLSFFFCSKSKKDRCSLSESSEWDRTHPIVWTWMYLFSPSTASVMAYFSCHQKHMFS